MNTLSNKIGFWSAIAIAFTFIAWIVCFTAIALTSPLFVWTNLTDYLHYFHSNNQLFQNIAKVFMLLFGPLFFLLINSFYDQVSDQHKVLARASLLFALAFALLSSFHYFVQLSSVRISLERMQTQGIEHFLQANPLSIMTAADMLGWTLFLGLSSFFISPIFKEKKAATFLQKAFFLNGVFCFLAGIGYLFQIDILTFVSINLGVGGCILSIAFASTRFFQRGKIQ